MKEEIISQIESCGCYKRNTVRNNHENPFKVSDLKYINTLQSYVNHREVYFVKKNLNNFI